MPNNEVICNSSKGRFCGEKPIDLGIAYSCRQVNKSDNKNSFTAQQVNTTRRKIESRYALFKERKTAFKTRRKTVPLSSLKSAIHYFFQTLSEMTFCQNHKKMERAEKKDKNKKM